jgi:Protein of unknown function (DUF1566)
MPYLMKALTIAALVLPLTVQAELLDRGRGLIYDSATNLTWQQNANLATTNTFGVVGINADGSMSWYTAMQWVAAMNAARYLGFDDWRLPTNIEADLTCGPNDGYQYNCTKVELGSIYFVALGNVSPYSSTGVFQPGYGLANLGPFQNLAAKSYWTSTELSSSPTTTAFRFDFAVGGVDESSKISTFPRAWAVRDGDVSVLTKLTLKSSLIAGCKNVIGTLTLSEPAPTGGLVVTITDTLAAAIPPATVTIPAGATTKSFTIKSTAVAIQQNGTVAATLDETTRSQGLSVRPIGLLSVSLTPTSIAGGNSVAGTAKLECPAAPGPVMVDLASSNSSAAFPVAANIAIPQGLSSQGFTVTTNAVLAKTSASISGSANGINKSKTLSVTPAASVSPTSIKFGNQPLNAPSATRTTTLQNKGATSYSISGIALTGTNASHYAMSEDCPGVLAAGASCTIAVTFKPMSAGSKPAKVTVTTTATSVPLIVSLSGVGVLPQ